MLCCPCPLLPPERTYICGVPTPSCHAQRNCQRWTGSFSGAGRTLWMHGSVRVTDRRPCGVRGQLGGIRSLGHWSGEQRDRSEPLHSGGGTGCSLGFQQCALVNQGGSRGETSGVGPWGSEQLGSSPGSAPGECDFGHLDPSLSFPMMRTTATSAFPDGWESG